MKINTSLLVILYVFALPITVQLSDEDGPDINDTAQEEITDQPIEDVTTATTEGEDHMMTPHFTALASTANIAPESGESTPTAPSANNQHRSTTTAFPGHLQLLDDGKSGEINATTTPSATEFQPTSISLLAFPNDNENLLQQKTESVGTDHGHLQTSQSQYGAFMQRADTKNFEEQRGEDTESTVTGTNDDQSVTTTVSTLFTVVTDNVDNLQQNAVPNEITFPVNHEHEHEDQQTTTKQHENFMPGAETNNIIGQVCFMRATTASATQEAQAPNISSSMLFPTPGEVNNHSQQNGKLQNTAFKAKYDDNTVTRPYVRFVPRTGTRNFKEQGRKFSVALVQPPQEVGTISTSPTISSRILDDEKDVMHQNGEPNETKVEANYDVITTVQDVDFISRTRTNNFKEQVDEFHAVTASSAQDVGTTTTSSSELFSTLDTAEGLTQQNVETTATTFENNYDGTEPTTPQYEHFISTTVTKNSEEQHVEFNTTTASSPQEIGTTATLPSMVSIVPSNTSSVTQQYREPTDMSFEVDSDGKVTTTPQYLNFMPETGTKNSSEQYDEFSVVTASSSQGAEMTTTSSSVLFTIPGDGMGHVQQNVETTSTTFDVDYINIEPSTPQFELAVSHTDTKNSLEEVDEFSSIMSPASHNILPPNSSPAMRLTVLADNENDTQQEGEPIDTTLAAHEEDSLTITSSVTPVTLSVNNESVEQQRGQPNITLISEPNADESTTTPSSTWFPQPVDKKNLTLEGDKSEGTKIFDTNKYNYSTMSFLTLFKILTALNGSIELKIIEPSVTTVLPISEETFSTTTAKQDTMTTPTEEETDGNKTESLEPSNTERSPEELQKLHEVHIRMLKAMSMTLGAVVVLFLITFGCKYLTKRRRHDRRAVPPENAGAIEAAQPSTSQASSSEEPSVRFKELLAREENE